MANLKQGRTHGRVKGAFNVVKKKKPKRNVLVKINAVKKFIYIFCLIF